jgi:hypothetical protein
VKYRVEWPDGGHYEEDGQSAFSRQHANAIVRALAGTIAGDAAAVPITESDQAETAPEVRERGAGCSGPRASSRKRPPGPNVPGKREGNHADDSRQHGAAPAPRRQAGREGDGRDL